MPKRKHQSLIEEACSLMRGALQRVESSDKAARLPPAIKDLGEALAKLAEAKALLGDDPQRGPTVKEARSQEHNLPGRKRGAK